MPHLRPRLLSRIRFRPSDGSECSDFLEIAEWNGSYQEVYSRSKTRVLVAAYANGASPEPTRNTVVDTMVLRDRPFQTTCGLISIVPNKPTAKSSATAASKPVPAAAMIPVLSVAPAPQTTATKPLSITTSTETSRQYPRGQRRQSNLGRVWQRRFGGNRCRNFPEDHRHSVAGSSGRVSTRFRKWSGLRQSPQVTYDRSCGSPIRKAGVNLVHHDRRRQFPNGAPSRRGTDPHRFPQPREARRVLDQRRCARVQPGRRTFQLKPHSFRPRCDPQARERLTRPLEARPDFTFCAGGDRNAWLEA
jgi:hypothetical protein